MSGDEPRWHQDASVDSVGQDRLARSVLRVVSQIPAGSLVSVQGAPGSGRDEFVRRVAWLASTARSRSAEVPLASVPTVVWFDAWSWCKQGHVVAGLILAVAAELPTASPLRERARELALVAARMRYDGAVPDGPGLTASANALDPVADMGRAFAQLVAKVREAKPARILLVVVHAERLTPASRWQLIDALRVLLSERPELVGLLSIGREAMLDAVRSYHGEMNEHSAMRLLDDIFDLSLTVPSLEVRRIGTLLRTAIGEAEGTIRRSFGREALTGLAAAVAHRPLGSPRFIERLAWRTVLLAEYAAEVRATRVLTEAQWAWVIVSERWPEFRRFMIRGGRQRWVELARVIHDMSAAQSDRPAVVAEDGPRSIAAWLDEDPILRDYLRLNAQGLAQDGEGIFWLESLLLAAGL